MIILPAIDIKEGQCVRLFKGDFATVHKVAKSPLMAAKSFIADGASIIHMVDLDGALEGRPVNFAAIREVLGTGIDVELGGGVRSIAHIEELLSEGVARVILGSVALKNPDLVKEAARLFGSSVAVGIDARDGLVSVEGWCKTSDVSYLDLAKSMEQAGVSNIIFTDIGRDGTLSGPNLEELFTLNEAVSCDITASGGVKDIGDIRALKAMGLYAAIAGKAVYSGTLLLKEAIEVAKEE